MSPQLNPEFTTRLTEFFETNPTAIEAASPLKDSAVIELVIDGNSFTFCKKQKANKLEIGSPDRPDVVFTLTHHAAEKIISLNSTSIGDFGNLIIKLIISKDPQEKIRVASRVGPFILVKNGYLGVLGKGGTIVAQILSQHGLGSFSKIKTFITKIKAN